MRGDKCEHANITRFAKKYRGHWTLSHRNSRLWRGKSEAHSFVDCLAVWSWRNEPCVHKSWEIKAFALLQSQCYGVDIWKWSNSWFQSEANIPQIQANNESFYCWYWGQQRVKIFIGVISYKIWYKSPLIFHQKSLGPKISIHSK